MAGFPLSAEALKNLLALTNEFNGQLLAGLSGKGDSGLKESEKLALIPIEMVETNRPEKDANTDWAMCSDNIAQCRVLLAMAHAARQAEKVGLTNKRYDDLTSQELPLGLEVCTAYTVVWAGLAGYFQADPDSLQVSAAGEVMYKKVVVQLPDEDHISEMDTRDPLYSPNNPV